MVLGGGEEEYDCEVLCRLVVDFCSGYFYVVDYRVMIFKYLKCRIVSL